MIDYLLHITISTHNFSVTRISSRVRNHIYQFIKDNLLQYGLVRIPGGKYVNSAVKVYSSSSANREEFRFHINMYQVFLDYMKIYSITENLIETVTKPLVIFDKISLPVQPQWIPREDQVPAIEYVADDNFPYRSRILELQTGKGKAQPLDARIKVPGGWSTMGNMQVGTEVISKDGTTTTVTAVYPQGVKDIYKFTFEDGRSTEACLEHLWKVYTDVTVKEAFIATTEQVIELLKLGIDVCIDLIKSEKNANRQPWFDFLFGKLGNRTKECNNLEEAQKLQYDIWSLGGIAELTNTRVDFKFIHLISYKMRLRLRRVEFIGKKEAQCISIDHPERLYITDDFIVTHNSAVSMLGMSLFSKRIAIIVKSMYIEKWVADVLKTYEIKESEIMCVSGSAQLQGLIQMGKLGILKSKIIIISNKTIQNWYKLYESEGKETLEMGYDCLPEDFFETIRCGVRLIDEVHQDFHLNFKIDLYTNIERSISLSATMVNYDQFMEKMYRIAYPTKTRFEGPALDKYVIARELSYHIKRERKYNITEYNSHIYSHHALERSILKDRDFADNYCKLIWNTIEIGFMHNYVKGQRCLIFCSSIDMCTKVTGYLKHKYPSLLVRRYVEDDPYENLLESDISVSTLQSAGTAHDIANLKTVILTVAINSLQSNVQSLGRLRKLKDANTYFFYFVCQDIPKHISYALDKEKMLRERAANFIQINAPFLV